MNYAITVRHPIHFSLFDFFISLWMLLLAVSGCVTGKSFQFLYFMIYFHLSALLRLPRLTELREEQAFSSPLPMMKNTEKTFGGVIAEWMNTQLGIAYSRAAWVTSPVSPVMFSHHTVPLKSMKHCHCIWIQTGDVPRAAILVSLPCLFLLLETSKKNILKSGGLSALLKIKYILKR